MDNLPELKNWRAERIARLVDRTRLLDMAGCDDLGLIPFSYRHRKTAFPDFGSPDRPDSKKIEQMARGVAMLLPEPSDLVDYWVDGRVKFRASVRRSKHQQARAWLEAALAAPITKWQVVGEFSPGRPPGDKSQKDATELRKAFFEAGAVLAARAGLIERHAAKNRARGDRDRAADKKLQRAASLRRLAVFLCDPRLRALIEKEASEVATIFADPRPRGVAAEFLVRRRINHEKSATAPTRTSSTALPAPTSSSRPSPWGTPAI